MLQKVEVNVTWITDIGINYGIQILEKTEGAIKN
jgi:hypothetical protein